MRGWRVIRRVSWGFVALALLAVGRAWACVPQPFVTVEPRASGPPGTEVTVEGTGFGSDPVEIRWNTLDGQRLASTGGPNFSLSVAIPDVPPGLYQIVVLSRDADASVTQKALAPFDVREDGSAVVSPRSEGQPVDAPGSPDDDDSSPIPTFVAIALGGLTLTVLGGAVGATVSRPRGASVNTAHDADDSP